MYKEVLVYKEVLREILLCVSKDREIILKSIPTQDGTFNGNSWGNRRSEKHNFPILALHDQCDVPGSGGFQTKMHKMGAGADFLQTSVVILPVDHYLSLLVLMICICFNKENIEETVGKANPILL